MDSQPLMKAAAFSKLILLLHKLEVTKLVEVKVVYSTLPDVPPHRLYYFRGYIIAHEPVL